MERRNIHKATDDTHSISQHQAGKIKDYIRHNIQTDVSSQKCGEKKTDSLTNLG